MRAASRLGAIRWRGGCRRDAGRNCRSNSPGRSSGRSAASAGLRRRRGGCTRPFDRVLLRQPAGLSSNLRERRISLFLLEEAFLLRGRARCWLARTRPEPRGRFVALATTGHLHHHKLRAAPSPTDSDACYSLAVYSRRRRQSRPLRTSVAGNRLLLRQTVHRRGHADR